MMRLADATKVNLNPGGEFAELTNITVPNIISSSLTIILVVATIVFFFMLVYGGIKWIISGGDKANTEAARNTITAALIGLIVVFAAWAIAALLSNLFGISIFELSLPDFVTGGNG
jgi:TRAP-type C4-dicarboxylate transport system permease small subunit